MLLNSLHPATNHILLMGDSMRLNVMTLTPSLLPGVTSPGLELVLSSVPLHLCKDLTPSIL